MSSISPAILTGPDALNPGTAYSFRVTGNGPVIAEPNMYAVVGGVRYLMRANAPTNGTSFPGTIPYAALNSMTNGSQTAIRIVFAQSTTSPESIGYPATMKSKADAETIPTIESVVITDQNPKSQAIGGFWQGISKLFVEYVAEAKYGASIRDESVLIDGSLQVGAVIPQNYGEVPLEITVEDTRRYITRRVDPVIVNAYLPPKIAGLTNQRLSSDPTKVQVSIAASVISILSPTEKNSAKVRILVMGIGGWETVLVVDRGILVNETIALPGTYEPSQSYELRVDVEDVFGTVSSAYQRIATEVVTYDLNGTHVGIGKYWEKGALDVGGTVHADRYQDHNGMGGIVPTGTVLDFAGSDVPDGWLLCDGSAYSVLEYTELWSVIGFRYGGSVHTFNVPDTTERVTVGHSPGSSEFGEVGQKGGTKTHTLTSAEIPNLTAASAGSHNHGVGGLGRIVTTDRVTNFGHREAPTSTTGAARVPAYSGDGSQTVGSVAATNSSGGHTHVVNSGGGNPHNNLPPYITFPKIIKV